MSLTVTQHNRLNVVQTLAGVGDTGAGASVRTLSLNEPTRTLNATSTPPATDAYRATVALSGGALTLDLTALAETGLPTLDLSTKKLQLIKVSNPAGNGALTVSEGATAGYPVYGVGKSIIIPAGAANQMEYADNAADVAVADAEIDFAGSGSETFDIIMIFG